MGEKKIIEFFFLFLGTEVNVSIALPVLTLYANGHYKETFVLWSAYSDNRLAFHVRRFCSDLTLGSILLAPLAPTVVC